MSMKTYVEHISNQSPATYEAYNAVKCSLMLALGRDGCKKIAVVSIDRDENNTETTANLALALSNNDKTKVLLVDGDFRNPKMYDFFFTDKTEGLSDTLTSGNTFVKVSIKEDDSLSLVYVKTLPSDASKLISSHDLKDTLRTAEGIYNYIVFNTPPLGKASDALFIAGECDGIVLSVRKQVTRHEEIRKTLAQFDKLGINVLGFIVHEA